MSGAAGEETIQKVAAALRANNIDARIVDTGEEARRLVLELVPEGAEVHSAKSKTLQDVGLSKELESGRYESVRARHLKMDRATQGREMGTFIGKLLVIRREWVDGRVTVILVRQPVGV